MNLEIYDSSEESVWETIKDYPISLTERELGEIIIKDYTIDIQVELATGDYTYTVELNNLADENRDNKTGFPLRTNQKGWGRLGWGPQCRCGNA